MPFPTAFPERYFHHLDLARVLLASDGGAPFRSRAVQFLFHGGRIGRHPDRHDGVTIGAGLASAFVEAMTQDDAVMEPALPARYVLHVGGLDWRKNIPTLIDAMALLPDTRSGALSLVLVGSGGQTEVSASRRSGRG
jgi:glycosyltransferase involved in cell wall biosynthesis